jgi:4-amino-4-deoxy-L-arabinose transferase-like glycosyltransferase
VTIGPERKRSDAPAVKRRFAAGALLPWLLALAVSFAGIFQHELWTPDEPREAEIGREMFEAGGSALPTLAGEPFLEKPPLFVWTMAASYAAFGVSAGAARIPAALFSTAALLAAYALGRHVRGRAAGLCAVVVLATTSEFWSVGHRSINDTALAAFVAWTHVVLFAAWERGRRRAPIGAAAPLAAGALAGLAFLTKGLIGPLLALAPPFVAFAWIAWRSPADAHARTRARSLVLRAGAAAVGGVLLFGLPWAAALARRPGGWRNAWDCVVGQVVARSFGGTAALSGHTNPPWYYLLQLPASIAPWIVVVPALLASKALRRGAAAVRARALAVLFVAGVVLLSLPSGKRGSYLVPLLPAFAAVAGAWLASIRAARPLERITARVLIGVVGLAGLLLAAFAAAAQANVLSRWPALAPMGAPELSATRGLLMVAGAATLALAARSWRAARRPDPAVAAPRRRALATAIGAPLLLLLLASHALVRPLLDPVKGLRAGALAAAAAVPAGEPLLSFDADETTLAVLPFYSGRIVRDVAPERVVEEMERSGARHLLTMEYSLRKLPEAARARLAVVRTLAFTPTRSIVLLELAR